jgi:hypothetical protein
LNNGSAFLSSPPTKKRSAIAQLASWARPIRECAAQSMLALASMRRRTRVETD